MKVTPESCKAGHTRVSAFVFGREKYVVQADIEVRHSCLCSTAYPTGLGH